MFHVTVSSLNKSTDKLKDLVGFLKEELSIVVLTEAWADETAKNNALCRFSKYAELH